MPPAGEDLAQVRFVAAKQIGPTAAWGPRCDRHALTAMPTASTASASGEPAGRGGISEESIACANSRAERPIVSARRVTARSQPGTVPGGRPSVAAIVRPGSLGLGQQR
jgi:hypothetical protein